MYSVHEKTVKDTTIHFIQITKPTIEVTVMDYGAAIYDIKVPDKNGTMESVVIQYEHLEDYITNKRHLNATIGPTAGRIKDAMFSVGGQTIMLDKNMDNTHNLHGGTDALSYTSFEFDVLDEEDQTQVVFTLFKHGSGQHYPGNQQYTIIYTIKDHSITIEFVAETDEPTVVNLTNHAYFNLSGNMKDTILSHHMRLRASTKMKLDNMIPVGIETITSTPYDFRSLQPIKQDQLREIDDPYLLDVVQDDIDQATLIDPVSKRRLDVYTTYPCIVCYTDNFPMTYPLKYNRPIEQYMGVCFETQNPPNGIHVEGVESSILTPEDHYYHKTVFAFTVEE